MSRKAPVWNRFRKNDKVYKIANQDQASLMKNVGESMSLKGNVNGDTIRVSDEMM